MDKAMGTVFVALAIGALLGFGGGYYYMESYAQDQFAEGQAYQQDLGPTTPTYATAADLEFAWDDDDFDHSATVDGDGNVASDTAIEHTITVTNDDDIDATNVWIMLSDPLTGDEGLDDDLDDASDDVKVYIEYAGISKISLFKDGEYLEGYELGDIPAGSELEVAITVELLEHDDEDFPNGKTLDCEVYFYQPDANHVDDDEFTITT